MFKRICPYCGGSCEIIGGPDGNPFNKNKEETTVCISCGRIVSVSEPLQIPTDHLEELQTDVDIFDAVDSITLNIAATAEAAGVKRNAKTSVSLKDGSYPLDGDYPFGRSDVDQNPRFSLRSITIKGNEISIAGETFTIKELPKTITKKLTAYGYGYVPWEEIITITVSFE